MRWLGDLSSKEDYTTPGGGELITRQEFRDDADINVFLRRYGAPVGGPLPSGGEVDYDIRALDARMIVRDAREAFQRLPADLRARYGSWEALIAGVARGEVTVAAPDPVPVPAPTS